MQSTFPPGTRTRFLYYWAKAFSDSLASGDTYTSLRPSISILWFKEPVLSSPRLHSVFHLREDHGAAVFSPEIEFHVMELPKLHLAPDERQAKLERWARFLRTNTVEELEELAREDETMRAAKNALEKLSSDSDAQRLARAREMAIVAHQHLRGASFEEGEAKGRTAGRVEGRAEGLRLAIGVACSLLGLELDTAKTERLAQLEATELERVLEILKNERQWPREL